MKRNVLLGLFTATVLISLIGCPKPPPPVVDPPPPPPRDTVVTRDTTPTTPVEPEQPREIREEQFRTVYFDFDQFNLRSDARSSLDNNYQLLREHPDVIVRIEGHCDERGTVEYNLSLGEKRARACQDYLTNLGLAANRVSIISYGKERPAVEGSNEEAWARNRRAEFRIISQ